ncbi:protein draper-like [Penaeus japonicus]|uniref:protein draper-like n=1 Tax=Penaeus japonicus TaxID=27405 RepID=UPI001C7159DA|nr:protein draper-like [Penaeus japonicus]
MCKCDAILSNVCGEGCSCCVDCSTDTNNMCTFSGGFCRKNCGKFAYAVDIPCGNTDTCSCCKRCDENQCLAVHPAACTLSDESFCKNGHYFVKGEKESCGCCIPCAADDTCIAAGGYPERSGLDCRKGYSSVDSDDYCKCCVPDTESPCGRNASGLVIANTDYCWEGDCFTHYKQMSQGTTASGTQCNCCYAGSCRRCTPQSGCADGNGCCTTKQGCPCKDYVRTNECSSNDDVDCYCCKHKCHQFARNDVFRLSKFY